jgi:predicted MPP superfamily phosphohydrolase
MKILLVGDPHLQMSTFQQSIDLLKWIESVAEEHKPDVVCNLGDTFHNHAVLRVELLKEFQDHVLRVTQNLNTEYWYVLGNHDQYSNKSSKYHVSRLKTKE